MSDEPENLIVRLLQEMRRDMDARFNQLDAKIDALDAKVEIIKETQRLHGIRLDTYSENFHDIIMLLRDMATARDLHALSVRVDALEDRRQ
jgi:hypothetical protein